MQVTKKIEVPATTKTVADYCTCDLCGAVKQAGRVWPKDNETGGFVVNEVTVKYETGHRYPEGGFGSTFTIDMCPACWEEKFLPWLATFHATPAEEEWDY